MYHLLDSWPDQSLQPPAQQQISMLAAMALEREYLNIGYLDSLSCRNTFVHRLDARVKVLVSLTFIIVAVSFPKYEISGLLPFFIYPVFMMAAGDVPLKVIVKKIIIVSPFAVFVGIFNPLFDTKVLFTLHGVPITAGWISFLSILVKFVLTVSTAILLVAVTSFPGLCEAFGRLGLPRVFVVQLLFLYRYLFVLLEEALRMKRARDSRASGKKGMDLKTSSKLISVLLVRTIERADRIYKAMQTRGFEGEIRVLSKGRIRPPDVLFAVIWLGAFIFLKYYNPVHLIERGLVIALG